MREEIEKIHKLYVRKDQLQRNLVDFEGQVTKTKADILNNAEDIEENEKLLSVSKKINKKVIKLSSNQAMILLCTNNGNMHPVRETKTFGADVNRLKSWGFVTSIRIAYEITDAGLIRIQEMLK